MEYFRVTGPTRLSGTFSPKGNKNAALPIIAATLLTDQPIVLRNVPEIQDVLALMQILEEIGVDVERLEQNVFRITASDIREEEIPGELGRQIRASILLLGPMLARLGRVILPAPGGDVIGRRRLDDHFHSMELLGAELTFGRRIKARAPEMKGCYIHLEEASVSATENAIMACVLIEGTTTIYNAACEPHVQDLCHFLEHLGAKISGIGTNRLIIEGVETLRGGEWAIVSDHIEVGSIISLAAMTGSELTIENVRAADYHAIQSVYRKLGVCFTLADGKAHVPADQALAVRADLGGAIPQIADGVWPQFPSDLMSIAIVMATQVTGTVLFFEKLFESRMFFTDKLISMGAKIILCDPHRIVISGPADFYPGKLTSPDIRAGMAILLATLAAKGVSTIHNVRQIDRGYEQIDTRLNDLGAQIERLSE